MAQRQRQIASLSALCYTGISLSLALLFFSVAASLGGYTAVARYGGAAWVFLLSMIVTMPLITSFFKKRFGE